MNLNLLVGAGSYSVRNNNMQLYTVTGADIMQPVGFAVSYLMATIIALIIGLLLIFFASRRR